MGTSERNRDNQGTASFREMTPAHVRETQGSEFAEVMFLESARIYRLFKKNRKYEEILKRLGEAIAKKRVVCVLLDKTRGGIIEDVEERV